MTVCYAEREARAANALFDELRKDRPFHDGAGNWSEKRSRDFPYHYRDGVSVWVAPEDLGQGGDFLKG